MFNGSATPLDSSHDTFYVNLRELSLQTATVGAGCMRSAAQRHLLHPHRRNAVLVASPSLPVCKHMQDMYVL